MTTNTRIILIIVVVVVVICCISSIIIIHRKKANNNPVSQSDQSTEDISDTASQQVEKVYHNIGDLFKAVDWLGKKRSELDIPDEYCSDEIIGTVINIEGELFGVSSYGTAYFSREDDNSIKYINSVYYIVKNEDMPTVDEKIKEIYGEPFFETEEPYVESLGGAIHRRKFQTDTYILEITHGSKNNYTMLEFSFKNNKI